MRLLTGVVYRLCKYIARHKQTLW